MSDRIALAISDTDLHGTAFNDAQANQYKFECIDYKRPAPSVERDSGRLLNGRGYSHVIFTTKIHSPVISANEITATTAAFLEDYWNSNFKFISIYSGGAWGNYIEVLTDPGDFPWAFVEELEELLEVQLKMTEAR
jgi:hypothetical protein